jgi:hypothetical protein
LIGDIGQGEDAREPARAEHRQTAHGCGPHPAGGLGERRVDFDGLDLPVKTVADRDATRVLTLAGLSSTPLNSPPVPWTGS